MYILKRSQVIPASMQEIWSFFSRAENLQRITPDNLRFQIVDGVNPRAIYAGQVIQYKIRLLPFVKFDWTTEITHVSAFDYFVDEQRFGPYKFWHHLHRFELVKGGVKMTDEVHYLIPFGILGRLFHLFFICGELNRIFNHRSEAIKAYFQEAP